VLSPGTRILASRNDGTRIVNGDLREHGRIALLAEARKTAFRVEM